MQTTVTLEEWLKRVGSDGLPILSETDRQIASLIRQEGATAGDFANVILKDPGMTSQVLRMANTLFYNPSRQRINTVTRAVIVLGFQSIYSICVSKTVIEAFAGDHARHEEMRAVGRSLHAAVQARAYADAIGSSAREDLFIAALLYDLGKIALWTHAPDACRAIEVLQAQGFSVEEAQRRVLGFTANELTAAMVREWNLSPILDETFAPGSRDKPLSQLVVMANQIADSIGRGQREETTNLADRLARLLQRSPRETRDLVHDTLNHALELAARYGLRAEDIQGDAAAEARLAVADGANAQKELQLQLLGEISVLINQHADIGLLLEPIVEAIDRGIGMDRVVLLLISKDRKQLRSKLALGDDGEALRQSMNFDLGQMPWLQQTLRAGEPINFDPHTPGLGPDGVFRRAIGDSGFFLKPLGLGQRTIGAIYADRQPSGRPLTEADFAAFRLFAQQANLGLAYLDH